MKSFLSDIWDDALHSLEKERAFLLIKGFGVFLCHLRQLYLILYSQRFSAEPVRLYQRT